MQRCPNCGAEISSDFCYNCGWREGYPTGQNAQGGEQTPTSFSGNTSQDNSFQNGNTSSYGYVNQFDDGFLGNNRLSRANGTSATVKAMDWFKLCGVAWLLCLIPLVGGIASLIFQLVMLCKQTTAPSIRGYLKFQFIITAIAVALTIVLLIVVFAIVGASAATAIPSIGTTSPVFADGFDLAVVAV